MPSQTFLLGRPESTSGAPETYLPQYTRDPKLPSYLQPRESTIADFEDEKQALYTSSTVTLRRSSPEHRSTLIPQALLVDAATSLTAYLYFTSSQARMALQQQSSLDLLSTLCSSLPEDVDSSLLHTCAHAISHEAESLIAAQTSYSHRLAILVVLVKAFFGYSLLSHVSKVVKPFDYLVASSALHCLVLYTMVFIPVASLMLTADMTNGTIWLRVMTKVVWLVALCCAMALVQWALLLRQRTAPVIPEAQRNDVALSLEQDKPSISLA